MKIEQSNLKITDVPGVESITVEKDKDSDGGVHVEIALSARKRISFGVKEFAEFVDACVTANDKAGEMTGEGGDRFDDRGSHNTDDHDTSNVDPTFA